MPNNEPATQTEYYRWEVNGRPIQIRLSLDFVDRLLQEVMRGFGAMPRRGVEMGGILLGSIDTSGDRPVVVVEDYEPIPCQHARGAAYQLSPEETARFRETVEKWSPEGGKQSYAVGYYRSHTREGLGMSDEDLSVYTDLLPDPNAICLLVKPFATRVSQAGLFFREAGGNVRTQSSYREFPFRRRELKGVASPAAAGAVRAAQPAPAAPLPGASEERAEAPEPPSQAASNPPQQPYQPIYRSRHSQMASAALPVPGQVVSDEQRFGLPTATTDPKTGKKFRTGWVWIPLSFIFLLLGVMLGLQVSLSLRNQLPAGLRPDPYSLHLTVTPSGENLHVRWDRDSGPLHSQAQGILVINDAGAQKVVRLDADQLRNGSVVYKRASSDVSFRLEVQTTDRVSVSETMSFRVEPAAR